MNTFHKISLVTTFNRLHKISLVTTFNRQNDIENGELVHSTVGFGWVGGTTNSQNIVRKMD
jgi:hypothetical protein